MNIDTSRLGDIGITEAQIDMLVMAENFCRDKSPIEKVRALMQTESGFDAQLWADIGALGWLGIAIPEQYGGVGLSMTEVVPVVEQMGRYLLHSPFVPTTLAAQAVLMGGTEALKTDILPQICQGQAATLALFEQNGDWDLSNIQARVTQSDNKYMLSGTKVLCLDLLATQYVVVSVKLKDKVQLIVIPTDVIPAHHIRREILIDEIKRGYELTLDGIEVPETALMDASKTPEILKHIHLSANLLSAAEMTGACQATIDYTVNYLKTRSQFGKLIGSFQALKHPTVDAFVDYQKSRSLLYAAAFSFERQGEGEVATRMAKVQADKALSFAADRSIQFHGGFGFTYDCDAQLYRRRAIFETSQHGDAIYHRKKLADLLL